MVSTSEVWAIWQEAFNAKDSSRLAHLLSDDYVLITPAATRNKQEALDWVDSDVSPVISNLQIIYENDEVVVCYHDADGGDPEGNARSFTVMCCGKKRDGQFYEWIASPFQVPG